MSIDEMVYNRDPRPAEAGDARAGGWRNAVKGERGCLRLGLTKALYKFPRPCHNERVE